MTAQIIWLICKTESSGKTDRCSGEEGQLWSCIDHGRESCCVEVNIEGVSVTGIVNTGSEITIVRDDQLYHIVSTAGVEADKIRPADQKACTYDQKPISLDEQIDPNINFGENTSCQELILV